MYLLKYCFSAAKTGVGHLGCELHLFACIFLPLIDMRDVVHNLLVEAANAKWLMESVFCYFKNTTLARALDLSDLFL